MGEGERMISLLCWVGGYRLLCRAEVRAVGVMSVRTSLAFSLWKNNELIFWEP